MSIGIQNEEVVIKDNIIYVKGSLRLPSPLDYDTYFEPIKSTIETASIDTPCKIDITQLKYLNSSGLTALGRLFILARKKNIPLHIIATSDIPWHKKSIPSLQKLWNQITVDFC
ncbi:MAG: hypothetical protein CL521_01215 [Actinobacteria bacterium]|mgnify:CR=1 FL=1|nr:hypothetical protein [Actinomycetota bacterium]|tara:strand:- start:29 stop:370 length:342 start_codon:yes stop_codon:yes gene_type:complete